MISNFSDEEMFGMRACLDLLKQGTFPVRGDQFGVAATAIMKLEALFKRALEERNPPQQEPIKES